MNISQNSDVQLSKLDPKIESSPHYSSEPYNKTKNETLQDTDEHLSKFETKIKNSLQYSSELDPKTNYDINNLSLPNVPMKRLKQQSSNSAHSISTLKFQENNPLISPSLTIYANTTFCTACPVAFYGAHTHINFEYNGSTHTLVYEITPYFVLAPWENLEDFTFEASLHSFSNYYNSHSTLGSWGMGETFSDTIHYGANIGYFRSDFYFVTRTPGVTTGNYVVLTLLVRDTTKPVLLNSPENQILTGRDFNLNWTATDLLPDHYIITQDGVQVQNGVFHSNQTVNYSGVADGLITGPNEFTMTFFDTSGNNVSHTTHVIVTDVTPPAFERPNNLVYEAGTTGNRLIWKPVDLNTPGSYTLLSPTGEISGTWDNNDNIVVDVDNLPIGVHNYTVIIRDFYRNFGQDTVLVTVYDQSPPEITFLDSITIEYGTLNYTLSWTPTDSNPSHYTLKKDGIILVENQQWVSGKSVQVSLNGLPVGTTRYEIIFYDQAEWSISDSVTVNVVDTSSPRITQEITYTVERDIVLNNPEFYYLNWVLTDLNPTIYTITVTNTVLQSSSWKNGDEVLYFLSTTVLGTYIYTIMAQDLYGNTAQQSVEVIVQDTLSPVVTNLADKIYDYGNYNYSFSWFATDGRPARYNITVNDTLLHEGTWGSGQAIKFASIQPELGLYHFKLKIWDISGNLASDNFNLRIGDSDVPNILSPGSQLLGLWATQFISWEVTDLSGSGSYELSKNGKIFNAGLWVSGIPIELQVQTNVTGTYIYELLVKDTSGTVVSDQITVTIFVLPSNSRLPEIPDKTLEFGTTGEMLIWLPENFNNGNYTITQNGQLLTENSYWLSKTPITLLLDSLSIGNHVYNLTILDFSNTFATDTVKITVRDTTEPELITPPEVEFSITNIQRFFLWKAIDWHPRNYQFILDTQLITNGSWINNHDNVLQLSNHVVGTYNYTLIVFDHFNNNKTQTIKVTIYDKLKPVITPVANRSYELGHETLPIIWMITDDTPDYFKVYKNDSLLLTNFWETEQILSINITNLPVGTHNYTLVAYDHRQNVASTSVFIKIEDTTAPILEASDDLHLQVAQTGQSITWRAFDLQADSYSLWQNSSLSQTGTWLSGEALTFSLTVTISGTYNYTLLVVDSSLNMASSSIFVFAVDQFPPRISSIQSKFTLEYGSLGNELIWEVFEAGKWNYTITHDNKQVILGQAETNQIIIQAVDTSELGTSLYTLSIVDSAMNTASRTLVVNVIDTTKPVLIEEPSKQIFSYNQVYNLTWSAIDLLPDSYQVFRNGNPIKLGFWENLTTINYPLTQLLPGEYNFTIIFSDSSGNLAFSMQLLTIEDKILPLAVFTGKTSYELTNNGYTLSWEVSDDFPEELIIVQDLYLSSPEISTLNLSEIENHFNTPINSKIESLHDRYQYLLTVEGAVLLHKRNYENFVVTPQITLASVKNVSYTLLIYDQSKNLNYNSINTSIIDTTIPEFTLKPNLTTTETEFTWSATDLTPSDYEILINGSKYEVGTWNSTQKIKTSLDALEPGFYEISIKIRDESLNHNSYQFYLIKAQSTVNNQKGNPENRTTQIFSTSKKIRYEMGSTINQIITWNRAGQSSNLQYQLLENGKITRASEVWPEGLQLSFNLNFLTSGIHNFTLNVKDATGDFYRNTTLVEVQDTIAPKITTNHQTSVINSTSGNISIVVKLSDINPEMYDVYLNTSFINSDSWKNDEIFVINLKNLHPGNYELLIIGYDSHANNITKKLTITVFSSLLNNTPNNQLSLEIVTHYLWWFIIIAIPIAITLIVARKASENRIKKNN